MASSPAVNRLKLVYSKAIDSIKSVNNNELSESFAILYNHGHRNNIESCVINFLEHLGLEFEVFYYYHFTKHAFILLIITIILIFMFIVIDMF